MRINVSHGEADGDRVGDLLWLSKRVWDVEVYDMMGDGYTGRLRGRGGRLG